MGKKITISIAGLLVAAGLAWGPKELWFHNQATRKDELLQRVRECGINVPCLDRVNHEMDAMIAELQNPPWYVWGGDDFK